MLNLAFVGQEPSPGFCKIKYEPKLRECDFVTDLLEEKSELVLGPCAPCGASAHLCQSLGSTLRKGGGGTVVHTHTHTHSLWFGGRWTTRSVQLLAG